LILTLLLLLVPGNGITMVDVHRVGVLPFANANNDPSLDWLTQGIPETITSDLQAFRGMVLVERLQIRKVMDEQKLQHTGLIDEDAVVKLGRLIGANILVVGAFQKQGELIRLTARFVDVQTGGIIQTAKSTGKMEDIFDLQDQIVQNLIKNLNIESKQGELAKIGTRTSLEAYKHFGQGALLQARKDYQGAAEEFGKAVKTDPAFTAAKEKFKEAFWSLNRNNYWAYAWVYASGKNLEEDLKVVKSGEVVRHAGGKEYFDNKEVFTYIEDSHVLMKDYEIIDTHTNYYMKGDEGIYDAGSRSVTNSRVGSSTHVSKYDPLPLLFPYELKVGKEWKTTYKSYYSNNSHLVSNVEEVCKIVGKERISVPAGTFDCYIIERMLAEKETEQAVRQWFSPGIGIVKIASTVNVKISGDTKRAELMKRLVQARPQELQLTKYHIEE